MGGMRGIVTGPSTEENTVEVRWERLPGTCGMLLASLSRTDPNAKKVIAKKDDQLRTGDRLVWREYQCSACGGTGRVRRTKRDGTGLLRPRKCHTCDGTGRVPKLEDGDEHWETPTAGENPMTIGAASELLDTGDPVQTLIKDLASHPWIKQLIEAHKEPFLRLCQNISKAQEGDYN